MVSLLKLFKEYFLKDKQAFTFRLAEYAGAAARGIHAVLFAFFALLAEITRNTQRFLFGSSFVNWFSKLLPVLGFFIVLQVLFCGYYFGWPLYDQFVLSKCQQYINNVTPTYQFFVDDSIANLNVIYRGNWAFRNLTEPNWQLGHRPQDWVLLEEEYRWRLSEPFVYYYGPDWTVHRASAWWRLYQSICDFRLVSVTTTLEDFNLMREYYIASLHYPVGDPERFRVDLLYNEFERTFRAAERYNALHNYIDATHGRLEFCRDQINTIQQKNPAFPVATWKIFTVISVAIFISSFLVAKTVVSVGVLT